MGARYFAAATAVYCRQWDDEFVAYDASHAKTHLLSAVAGEVLLAIQGNPSGMTRPAIEHALFGALDAAQAASDFSADDSAGLEAVLGALLNTSLIELRSQ